MGISTIGLSLYYKAPIITAWSTPGAALLATGTLQISMAEAVGAFLFSGLLITMSGLTGAFERLNKFIPPPIAAAMLAGILVQFGLQIFSSLEQEPILVGLMGLSYLLAKRFTPRFAILVVLCVGILASGFLGLFAAGNLNLEFAKPVFTAPQFSLPALIGLGVPLFIVTMSSQNMPGIAVMHASGYRPSLSPIITTTGITTLIFAAFGGFAMNLAAITAAICMSEDADPKRQTRYLAAVSAGIVYLIAAVFGATIVALFAMSPKAMILPLAGLALLGTLGNSLAQALQQPSQREAAL